MLRVFILSRHPLFGRGVELLVGRESGLSIVGKETDVERGIDCVRSLAPDVVILDTGDPGFDPSPVIARVLGAGTKARILGINLEENLVCLYHEETRPIRAVSDLIAAIRGSD